MQLKGLRVQCPVEETLLGIRKALGSILSTGEKKREERKQSRTLGNTSGTRGPKLYSWPFQTRTRLQPPCLSPEEDLTLLMGVFLNGRGCSSCRTAIGSQRRHSPLVSANLPIDKKPAPVSVRFC